jgi:hypothetical protein
MRGGLPGLGQRQPVTLPLNLGLEVAGEDEELAVQVQLQSELEGVLVLLSPE